MRARAWPGDRGPAEPVLLVAASLDSANELLRQMTLERAVFGWHRLTPG